MKRTRILGSYLNSYGYDKDKKILAIGFRNGIVYHYHDFPEDMFKEFCDTHVKTSYYINHIRGEFYCELVEGRAGESGTGEAHVNIKNKGENGKQTN